MKMVSCHACGALFDGSSLAAGAQFACDRCSAIVVVPGAGASFRTENGASPAVREQPTPRLASASVVDPHQPYGRANDRPGAPSADWNAPRQMPSIRSIGGCIALQIITLGIYGVYWTWAMHEEHPSRSGDASGFKAILHIVFIPIGICLLGLIAVIAVGAVFAMTPSSSGPASAGLASQMLWIVMLVFYTPVVFAYIYSLVWRAKIYGRLTARVNQLTAMIEGHGFPPVSGTLIVVAQVLWFVFPPAGLICELIWWIGFQDSANRLAVAAAQPGH